MISTILIHRCKPPVQLYMQSERNVYAHISQSSSGFQIWINVAWLPTSGKAYLHCVTRTRIPTEILTPKSMAILYCTESDPIAQIQIEILILIQTPDHYCTHSWGGYPIGIWVYVQYCKPAMSQFLFCIFTYRMIRHSHYFGRTYQIIRCSEQSFEKKVDRSEDGWSNSFKQPMHNFHRHLVVQVHLFKISNFVVVFFLK